MANGQNQLSPAPIPPLPPARPVEFNLPQVTAGQATPQGIFDILSQQRPSFTQQTFPSVLPLLTPSQGLSPEIAEAIKNIQTLGQEGIQRGVATATTEAQKRGLTGSSIEAGQIGEAQRRGELDILGQITPLIAGEAERKVQQRTQLASFLTQAFGVDFSAQTDLLDKLAQAMGEELGRQTQLELGSQAASASEKAGLFGGIGSAIGGAGAAIGGIFSDKRLKENIKKVGKLDNGLDVYVYRFKGESEMQIGLIAQDVKKVKPEAVGMNGKFLTVDYGKAVK